MWKTNIIKSVTTDNQRIFRIKDKVKFKFKYSDKKVVEVMGTIEDILENRIAILMDDRNIHYFDYDGIVENTSEFVL